MARVEGAGSSDDVNPLPRKEVILLVLIFTGQSVQHYTLITLMVFMVGSYDISADKTTLGQYTGLALGMFFFAACATSLVWGCISDIMGRKPCLAVGSLVSAVSMFCLAFSRNYVFTCAVLLTCGVFNCTFGVIKAIMGELCDKTNQSNGFAYLTVSLGVGPIVGSLVGGLLAQPCTQYKTATCPLLLEKFPFLLPFCFAGTLIFGTFLCGLCITETNPHVKPRGYVRLEDEGDSQRLPRGGVGVVKEVNLEQGAADMALRRSSSFAALTDKNVILACFLYGVEQFCVIYADTIFSLICATEIAKGGFGYSSSSVGTAMAFYGSVMFVFTLVIYPVICRQFGPKLTFTCVFAAFVLLWPSLPLASLLPLSPNLKWLLVLSYVSGRAMFGGTGFSIALMFVSNSSTSLTMGTVTGFSDTFGSILRALAPTTAGLMWSSSMHYGFPLHPFAPSLFVSAISLAGFVGSIFISPGLASPKRDETVF